MKNVFIFSLLLIGMCFTSCDVDSDDSPIMINQSEQVINSHEKGVNISLKGRLNRGKKVTNSGRECNCQKCFGICGVTFDVDVEVFTPIKFVNENGLTYLYLLESVTHAEELFYVDDELVVPVEGDEMTTDRVLQVGEYVFEQANIDYEDVDPETPTYGRVQVIVE